MDRAALAAALGALGRAHDESLLTVVEQTASTNEDARAAAATGAPHGAAFVADHQSAGRGRLGRSWYSPAGRNIHLSVVLRPAVEVAALPPLSLVAGLGVARVVDGVLRAQAPERSAASEPPLRARIKWPNDVYLEGRKVAGVLVEAQSGLDEPPLVVVGVGLNVLGDSFPPELAATATSLALAGGRELQREPICAALIAALVTVADAFAARGLGPFLGELGRRDFLRGRPIEVAGHRGEAEGIDETGCLLVRGPGGRLRAVHSGEVSWHLVSGAKRS